MDGIILKTSADDLYELVKSRKKISVEEAAQLLKIPVKTTQALVDFLVEEKIFGIEYKFTTPYIYISKEKKEETEVKSDSAKKLVTKEEFFKKEGTGNIPYEKIDALWKKYVEENLNSIKEEFYTKAHSRNLPEEKIGSLWERYLHHLM